MKADSPRMLTIELERASTNRTNYSRHGQVYVTTQYSHIEHTFVMEKPNDLKARFVIRGGEYEPDFEVKNVSLRQLVVAGTPQRDPTAYKLNFYPNPASDKLHIAYDLETTSHIKLELLNMNGQLIQSVYEGDQIPGNHKISFDTSTLADGAYLLHFTDGVLDYSNILLVQH